jgi:thymidine phosphorylase
MPTIKGADIDQIYCHRREVVTGNQTSDSTTTRVVYDVLANVGMQLHAKVGDRVASGETLCTVFAESEEAATAGARRIGSAYSLGSTAPDQPALILDELASLEIPS